MERDIILAKVDRLLKNPEQIFILSTLNDNGYPDARLMGNICGKTIHELYFSSRARTHKVGQIVQSSKSSVYFNAGNIIVWLYGDAFVTADESIRKRVWNNRMLLFYPDGVNSPELRIIRFVPQKIRYCENIGEYIEFDL